MLVKQSSARPRAALLLGAAMVMLLTACGSKSDAGGPASGKSLYADDFKSLCSGKPVAGAAAYDKAKTGIHPVVGFGSATWTSDDGKLDTMSNIPASFSRQFESGQNKLAEVELVSCAKRVKDSVVKKCDGYKRDGKITDQVVTLHNATYEVTLYAAKTGEEVAKKTIDTKGTACPSSVSSGNTDEYLRSDGEIMTFIQPYVKTGSVSGDAAGTNKKPTTSDFEGACFGAPVSGAAAYDKSAAGVHPVLGYRSTTLDTDATNMLPISTLPEDLSPRYADDSRMAEVQLVVCAKRVKDTVVKECDGYKAKDGKDNGQKVALHNATYEVKLHAAKTGDEVATTTIDAQIKDCPRSVSGDATDNYASADAEVVKFIQAHAKTS